MRFNFRFDIKFRGVKAGPKKITHPTKVYKDVLAADAHRAIDLVREEVAKDPKLKDLHYPTYTVVGMNE